MSLLACSDPLCAHLVFYITTYYVDTYSYMKYLTALSILFFTPLFALAHTKWFAENNLTPLHTNEPTTLYLSVWAIVVVLIVGCGVWLESKGWLNFRFLEPKKPHVFARAGSTFVIVA